MDKIAEKRRIVKREVLDFLEGPFMWPPTTLGDVLTAADDYALEVMDEYERRWDCVNNKYQSLDGYNCVHYGGDIKCHWELRERLGDTRERHTLELWPGR